MFAFSLFLQTGQGFSTKGGEYTCSLKNGHAYSALLKDEPLLIK